MATVSTNNIAQAIYGVSKGKSGHALHVEAQNVVKFLARRRLMSKAPEILAKLKKIINSEEGILEAKVTSSEKLSRDAKHHIELALKKRYGVKEVELEEEVDENALGGFKIEAEDEVIDLTGRGKINKLKEHLTK